MINIKFLLVIIILIIIICNLFKLKRLKYSKPLMTLFLTFLIGLANTGTSYARSYTVWVPYGSDVDISIDSQDEGSSYVKTKISYTGTSGSSRAYSVSWSQGRLVYSDSGPGWRSKSYEYPYTFVKTVTGVANCRQIDLYKECSYDYEYYKGDGTYKTYTNYVQGFVRGVTGNLYISMSSDSRWEDYNICVCTSHNYQNTWDSVPTCTSGGVLRHRCTKCGYAYTENVGALGHAWPSSWSQDASNHWADCTRCGGRIHTGGHYDNDGNGLCDVCGRDIQPPRIPRVTYVKDSTGFYAYSFVQDNSWVQATRWWVWNTADNNWRYFESAESGDWWVNGSNYNRRIRINIGNFSNSTGPYHVDCRAYDGNWLCSDQVANNSNLFLRVCSDVYIDNVPPILDRSTYKIDQNGVDCYVHAYDPPDRSSGLNHLNVCTWNINIGDWTTGKTFDIANEGNWTIDGQNYNYYYRVNKTDFQNFNTGYYSAARIFDNSGSQREAWDGTGSVKQVLSNVGLTTHLIFDANGGTVNGNLTYEADWVIGSSQTPPVPIKTGYTFVGWDGWTGIVPVAAATYKAVWTEHLLKVTLDLNKPETSILIPTCEKSFITGHYTFPYNKRETLPDPLLTDYVFDGWYSDPIAGDKIMPDTIVSKSVDHILYAHWIAKPPLLINTLNSQEVIEYTGLSDVDYLNQHGVINSTGTKTLSYPYSITHYKIISSGGIDASGNTNRFEWYTSKDQINWTKIHCPENGLYTYSDGVTARVECQKTKTGTTSELILSNVNRTYHHNFYKCVIINNAGSITSNTANLTVFWLPKS